MAYEAKTKPTTMSVEKFLKGVEDKQRREDCFAILDMMKDITKLEPKMWGPAIVGFGEYHYKYASGHEGDCCIIGFSPRKQNLTLYIIPDIIPGFDRYEELMNKLGKYSTGKCCLYIKRLSDVDVPTLKKIIKESFTYEKKKLGARAAGTP